jgi:hypothetical protein
MHKTKMKYLVYFARFMFLNFQHESERQTAASCMMVSQNNNSTWKNYGTKLKIMCLLALLDFCKTTGNHKTKLMWHQHHEEKEH